MEKKLHNYDGPNNYQCIPMPDTKTCRRLRIAGCPYITCKRYTVAFWVKEDNTPGEIIMGWKGYSQDCPTIPFWDKEGKPWCVIETDFLTE